MPSGRTSTEICPKLESIMADAVEDAENRTGSLRGTYRVDVELLDNVTTEARPRGFRLFVDEPPSSGADAGPNPEEVLRAGDGTCQAITAALYAALLGIPIERYSARPRGDAGLTGLYDLSDDPPKGFARVRCEVTLEADAPEERWREFERMVEDRCDGHVTLRNPVEVQTVWKITGSDNADGTS